MKKNLTLLLLLFHLSVSAALAPFTLTVTPTNENCIANGALSWVASGTTDGSAMVYAIYKSPNYATAIATTSASTYSGLSAGTYRVIATQTLGGESNSAQKDATIANTFVALNYTVATTPELCGNDGKITVTVTAGAAATYAITAGPVTRVAQASNVFTDLPGGSYTVSVVDICGNIKNMSQLLASYPSKFTVGNRIGNTLTACDAINTGHTLTVASGYSIVYPVTYKFTVHPPDGSADIVVTKSFGTAGTYSTNNTQSYYTSIPFYYNQAYTYDLEMTDACGTKVTGGPYTINRSMDISLYKNSSTCSGQYFYLSNLTGGVAPYTVEFLSAPVGFVPEDYDRGGINTTFPGPYTSTAQFGSSTQPVPDGTYNIKVTDACGNTVTKSTTVAKTIVAITRSEYFGCEPNHNYLQYTPPSGSVFASAQVTAAPAAFSAIHPLPYEAPIYNGSIRLTDVPNGTYTIVSVDTCGITRTSSTTTAGYVPGTTTINRTDKCGNFDLSVIISGTNTLTTIGLQKYYPASGRWGHPITGTTQIPVNSINSSNALYFGNNYNATYTQNNIASTGQFRVVRYRTGYIPGSTVPEDWRTTQCVEVINEFTFDQTFSVQGAYGFKCPGGTTTDVGILAKGGLVPLTYKITQKDGASFVVDNGTDNLFTGLTAGVYNFEVKDACGNTFNVKYDITTLGMPKVRPENLCNGENGQLVVEGVPYLNFEWWKEGSPGTILSTSYNLPFTPFNDTTDPGRYYVRLTSPKGSSCINEVLTFNISGDMNNPKAGDDTTTKVSKSTPSIDLMNYLSGTYDTYGTFTETTVPVSGYLNGSKFYPSQVPVATYTFKYTVNGLCSGTDEAIITIIVAPNYWIGTTDTIWDKTTNWTANVVPGVGEDVEFATTANNNGNPAVNDLYVPAATEKTIGNLINLSDKATVIPAGSSLIVNGNVTGSETDASKIQIKAAENTANGTFIINCTAQSTSGSPDVYVTVDLYAKGKKDVETTWEDNISGSPTNGTTFKASYHWQHFGVPVETVKANPTFYGSFLRKYFENYNGTNTQYYQKWKDLTNESNLIAFEGYEITQDTATTYSIAGKLQYCDKTIELTRSAPVVTNSTNTNINNDRYGLGQNIFGNSYTASIDITKLDFTSQPKIEPTVYLYNTGRFTDWANTTGGGLNAGALSAGQYTSIPQNVASTIYDGRIPSMNGFLLIHRGYSPYYKSASDDPVTMTLPYANNLLPNTKPQTAPRKPLSYLQVNLQSKSTRDNLWLFSEEGTTNGNDDGWDGRKFFGTPTAFIYTENADGPKQVNADKTIDGSVLSFYANDDTDYTLTLTKTNLEGYTDLQLIDLVTRTATPLTGDVTTYRFTADSKGKVIKRFIIANSAYIDLNSNKFKYLDGYVLNNNRLIINNFTPRDGTMYLHDISGKTLINRSIPTAVTEVPVSLQTGVYILNLQADGKQETIKLIIK